MERSENEIAVVGHVPKANQNNTVSRNVPTL